MKSILNSSFVTYLLAWLFWAYMMLCARTIRWHVIGEEAARQAWLSHPGMIIASWHSMILLMPSGWTRNIQKWPRQKVPTAMLISLSKEGNVTTQIVKRLGMEAIRGSSTHKGKKRDKGGQKALVSAMRLLRSGGGICITVDGPRGPAELAQPGPIMMAQKTGTPILPYTVLSSPSHRMKTWDGLRIPYPFTKGVIVFGPVLTPQPDDDRETQRLKLETALKSGTLNAQAYLDSRASD